MKTICQYVGMLLLFFFSTGYTRAQNMVHNGNFESYTFTPSSYIAPKITDCNGWRQYEWNQPIYYNYSYHLFQVSVPLNNYGHQFPASGNGYVSISPSWTSGLPFNFKEYLAGTMTPLSVGVKYKVSMSVSLSDTFCYAFNGMGIWFYDKGPVGRTYGQTILQVTPQVLYPDTVLDKTNWVRLSATFVADSAYDNIVIGDFINNPATVRVACGNFNPFAYLGAFYYIDSVVVKRLTDVELGLSDTAFCIGDSIKVLCMLNSDTFLSNNRFTLQLSDDTGSFVNPIVLDTINGKTGGMFNCVMPSTLSAGTRYRMRIASSSPVLFSDTSGFIAIGNTTPAKPVASSNSPVCADDTLKLIATSATNGASYVWLSGNVFGTTGASQWIYPASTFYSGQYIVTAWLNGCHSSDTINVTVKPRTVFEPSYNFIPCQFDTLKLYATHKDTNTGATIRWTGPNLFSDTALNPTRIRVGYADTGYYVITASLNGCVYQDSTYVLIRPLPQNLNIISNSPQCQGDTLNLSANSTSNGVLWAWKGPGGLSSTTQSISFANAQTSDNGDYILTATLDGCTLKDTFNAHVIATPPTPRPTVKAPVCAGQGLYIDAGVNGASYWWSGPGNITDTSRVFILHGVTDSMSGVYTVAVTDSGCVSADTSITVLVKDSPNQPTIYPFQQPCLGADFTINAFDSTASVTWQWTGPGSFSAATQNITRMATAVATGWYHVLVDKDTCYAEDSVYVHVKPLPASVRVVSNAPICQGDVLQVSGSSSSSNTGYYWMGPANFSDSMQSFSIANATSAQQGVYKLQVSLDSCYVWDSISVAINTSEKPVAASNSPLYTGDVLKLRVDNVSSLARYLWTGPAGFTSELPNPNLNSVTAQNAGQYVVTAMENSCVKTDTVIVYIDDVQDSSFLKVYPNANDGDFTVYATVSSDQEVKLGIYEANGQLVYTTSAPATNGIFKMHISLKDALASGIYTLRVTIDKRVHNIPIAVRR